MAVYPDAVSGAANDIVTIPFLVKNFEAISGVQGTLAWDTTVMELVTQANDHHRSRGGGGDRCSGLHEECDLWRTDP